MVCWKSILNANSTHVLIHYTGDRKNLTLNADFVLSCARVRDEIHLH